MDLPPWHGPIVAECWRVRDTENEPSQGSSALLFFSFLLGAILSAGLGTFYASAGADGMQMRRRSTDQ